MPFNIKITGIPRDNTDPSWVIDDVRYPKYELMEDNFFRKSVDSTFYLDYVAILNCEEAIELHNKYRIEPSTDIEKSSEEELLEYLKNGAPATRWVLFEIYEWES